MPSAALAFWDRLGSLMASPYGLRACYDVALPLNERLVSLMTFLDLRDKEEKEIALAEGGITSFETEFLCSLRFFAFSRDGIMGSLFIVLLLLNAATLVKSSSSWTSPNGGMAGRA